MDRPLGQCWSGARSRRRGPCAHWVSAVFRGQRAEPCRTPGFIGRTLVPGNSQEGRHIIADDVLLTPRKVGRQERIVFALWGHRELAIVDEVLQASMGGIADGRITL